MVNFENIRNMVKEGLKKDSSGHDFYHTIRVFDNAFVIAKTEKNIDLDIVNASALLHDIAYSEKFFEGEHGDASAKIAEPILRKENFSTKQIDKILQAIKLHNFWFHNEKDVPKEVKILRDADRLDALGYIGIVRAISYAVSSKKDVIKTIEEQLVLEKQFETQKGKELAKEKLMVMRSFIENLKKDLEA